MQCMDSASVNGYCLLYQNRKHHHLDSVPDILNLRIQTSFPRCHLLLLSYMLFFIESHTFAFSESRFVFLTSSLSESLACFFTMNRISVIRKTDPPDSNTHVVRSEPGPSVSVSVPSSTDLPEPITKDTHVAVTVTGPGPSTGGLSRPGPSNNVIHTNNTDTSNYISGDYFDYFAGNADVSGEGAEEDDKFDDDFSVTVDNVARDDNEEDDNDILGLSEGDDDIGVSDDNEDNNNENVKKKRPRRNKWDERQELKWEHLTKKCLYEVAKEDMANGVFRSYRQCANYYNLVNKTLAILIKENREYVGDGKKSQG